MTEPEPERWQQIQGPVVRGDRTAQQSTTDQRLLESRGATEWVHSDPWRVLRIQSEFVDGFGTLAELGPAVSVFGSARTPARPPALRHHRDPGRGAGPGRPGGDHRRRAGRDGGGQQGCR